MKPQTQTQTRTPRSRATNLGRSLQPLRLIALSVLMVVGGFALQTAHATPGGEGSHGSHGSDGSYGERGDKSDRTANPRHMKRMLDSVEATPEQRAQIRQINSANQEGRKAQREQVKALRSQMATLMAQPNVDARAAETLRQQMMAQQDQASKQRMQTMLEVSRVLTPEQRQKMASRTEQRRSMLERHRSERQQLEGTRPL